MQKSSGASLDYIRVRISMIAAEKIRAGIPAERALAEASAEIRAAFASDIAEANRVFGVKSRW